jgi:hypothetical protein
MKNYTKALGLSMCIGLFVGIMGCELGMAPEDMTYEDDMNYETQEAELTINVQGKISADDMNPAGPRKRKKNGGGAGGTYHGPGDTVPTGNIGGDGGFNLNCAQNPLLNFYPVLCDATGNCMNNAYLHPYVAQAILGGGTIQQLLINESLLMRVYATNLGRPGYPKDTCKNLWAPSSWMFLGKGATPVQCMSINYGTQTLNYLDLHADVCSTTSLYYGVP